MRYFLLGVIMVLGLAAPVRADGDLTGAVASAYGSRTLDADLHAIAHARVVEISACGGCMTHDGMRPGTAEVLGFNAGYSDPVSRVLRDWQGSALHNGILSDRDYGRIGCAHRVVNGGHYFVCVLATGGSYGGTAPPPPPGGTIALPDTAMR